MANRGGKKFFDGPSPGKKIFDSQSPGKKFFDVHSRGKKIFFFDFSSASPPDH